MTTFATDIQDELNSLTRAITVDEPIEIAALRSGQLPNRPGTRGQYFTTWDFANGILRDYSMNLYQILRLATNDDLGVDSVVTVFRTLDPIYSEYLGYSGFTALVGYARAIRDCRITDRAELIALLTAFTGYVNRLTAWSHHYFPWHFGDHYQYPDHVRQQVLSAPDEAHEAVSVRLRWEPLGIEVTGAIYRDLNPQLCAEFLAALPFTVLQDHAVVTGDSLYAWTPIVSVAPVPVTERICDAPVGRLRFSQATGNKLVIQYGGTTETLSVPVLGKVCSEDHDRLRRVGDAVWDSTFGSKDHIWLTVQRC